MDYDILQRELAELRIRAESLLSMLDIPDSSEDSSTRQLFQEFVAKIETRIVDMAKQSTDTDMRLRLSRFLSIVSPEIVTEEFNVHRDKLISLLESEDLLSDAGRVYIQFIQLTEQPDLDLSLEEGDYFDTFFGSRITRLLYQGKFSFSPDDSCETEVTLPLDWTAETPETMQRDLAASTALRYESKPSEPIVFKPQPSVPVLSEQSDTALSGVEISTQKMNSSFSSTSFVNEYLRGRVGKRSSVSIARQGELYLLYCFTWIGALTLHQLEGYLFDEAENISAVHLNKLLRDGYLSSVKHLASDTEFYAISDKGAAIFKTRTSLDLMKGKFNIPKIILDCKSELASIRSDAIAYKQTATVALRIRNSKRNVFGSVYLERFHTDAALSTIYIKLSNGENNDVASVELVLMTQLSETVILSAKGFAEEIDERKCIDTLWMSKCQEMCRCKVEEDDFTIDCRSPVGEILSIDAFIVSLAQPTTMKRELKPVDDSLEGSGGADIDLGNLHNEIETTQPASTVEIIPTTETMQHTPTYQSAGIAEESGGSRRVPVFDSIMAIEIPCVDSVSMSRKMLEDGTSPLDSDTFDMLIRSLLNEAAAPVDNTDYLGRALVLLKALSLADKECYGDSYRRLIMALDLPVDEISFSTESLTSLFTGVYEGTALHLAALLRTLLLPSSQYDFQLTDYAKELFKRYDEVFSGFPMMKNTLDAFSQIGSVTREGFTASVVNRFLDDQTRQEMIKKTCADAKSMLREPQIHQFFNGAPEMMHSCFGQNSELAMCLTIIAENNVTDRDLVLDFFSQWTEENKPSPQRVEAFVDLHWKSVYQSSKNWVKSKKFHSTARLVTISNINERLEIIGTWLTYVEDMPKGDDSRLLALRAKLTESLRSAEKALCDDASISAADRAVFSRCIVKLNAIMEGDRAAAFLPQDWLSSGIFQLTKNTPLVDSTFEHIRYYEAWRNTLRHLAEKPQDLPHILQRIETEDDALFDNYGQALSICEYIGEDKQKYHDSTKNAREAAERQIDKFIASIGLDVTYGRVNEQSKETVLSELEQLKIVFFDRGDFAQLRVFLEALRKRLDDEIAETRRFWELEIEKRSNGNVRERAKEHLQKANFTLVEDALNQPDNMDNQQDEISLNDDCLFTDFIDEKNYSALLEVCKENVGLALRSFARKFVKERVTLSDRYKSSALRLLENLPRGFGIGGIDGIQVLLEELGFTVLSKGVTRDNPGVSPSIFTVRVEAEKKNSKSYKHPIADMGTGLGGTLRVIELFGNMEPRSIIDAVRKTGARRMPVVFLNGYLTLAQRRQMARLFLADGNAQSPFVLIDWVLLLYLAMKVPEERIRVALACAMPYTGVKQLFSSSSLAMTDEMYIGRLKEINKISEMDGPVIVYGGRQLGKTALLIRAKNMFHSPSENDYSVFVDIKECGNEESFVKKVLNEFRINADIHLKDATTIKDMCAELALWLKDSDRRLLLLMDESDKFLNSLATEQYAALTDFEALCRNTNRFKFVFAGLHNVFLAAKEANTIFGHFGEPVCIKPLSPLDAYKLLARPLRYLGFDTDFKKLEPLLVNTNFYPGVVHAVGEKLVEMLTHSYSAHYKESTNPPYQLEDEQIGYINKTADLSDQVDELILKTIRVDTSYHMLARCIAVLYYEEADRRSLGYDIESILGYGVVLGIDVLQNMKSETCANLLSELCDMSILVAIEGRYKFRQTRFLNIVGKSTEQIMDQIEQTQEEATL